MTTNIVIIRTLGLQDYQTCWQAMRDFTDQRTTMTTDEIWLVEHPPVFTQGQRGKPEHLLNPGTIPIIQADRGGQITYHGPGQLVVYPLVDLKRKKFNVRDIVTLLETTIIELLQQLNIQAKSKREAPGVYVDNKKICSIGLRIRRGCSFHGLALNVNMDLEPFSRINPCGYPNLIMTQLANFNPEITIPAITQQLLDYLIKNLGYTKAQIE